eukprot:scaffold2675_cov398-Prasinococcus_capsulatus_cf.AAC.4
MRAPRVALGHRQLASLLGVHPVSLPQHASNSGSLAPSRARMVEGGTCSWGRTNSALHNAAQGLEHRMGRALAYIHIIIIIIMMCSHTQDAFGRARRLGGGSSNRRKGP